MRQPIAAGIHAIVDVVGVLPDDAKTGTPDDRYPYQLSSLKSKTVTLFYKVGLYFFKCILFFQIFYNFFCYFFSVAKKHNGVGRVKQWIVYAGIARS